MTRQKFYCYVNAHYPSNLNEVSVLQFHIVSASYSLICGDDQRDPLSTNTSRLVNLAGRTRILMVPSALASEIQGSLYDASSDDEEWNCYSSVFPQLPSIALTFLNVSSNNTPIERIVIPPDLNIRITRNRIQFCDTSNLRTLIRMTSFSSHISRPLSMYIFFFIATWCQAAFNVETPVFLDESGWYWVNATREFSSGEMAQLTFGLRFNTHSVLGPIEEFPDGGPILRFGSANNSIRYHVPGPTHAFTGPVRRRVLGIQPHSGFIDDVGPVAIVHESLGRKFVVNVTDQYWTDHCVDNSTLIFPLDSSYWTSFAIAPGLSLRLSGSPSTGLAPIEWSGRITTQVNGFIRDTISHAPSIIINRIHDDLTSSGAIETLMRRGSRNKEYSNCTEAMVQALPDLTFAWPTIGELVITGPEYMHHNASNNT